MKRRRNSLRLNVFDYSQPAAYFVTLCTHDRMRVLGRVVNGRMILSETGKIVENVWKEIPDHFPTVQVEVFQIMPDHVHGIVEIRDLITQNKSNPVGVEYIQPQRENPSAISLQSLRLRVFFSTQKTYPCLEPVVPHTYFRR